MYTVTFKMESTVFAVYAVSRSTSMSSLTNTTGTGSVSVLSHIVPYTQCISPAPAVSCGTHGHYRVVDWLQVGRLCLCA